jgi:hypothetical protein
VKIFAKQRLKKKTESKPGFDITLTKRNSSPNWKEKIFAKLEMIQKISTYISPIGAKYW